MSDAADRLLPVEAASKSYGGRSVLQELDITLQPRQVMALPGPDGAGKSTAMCLMNGRVLQVMQAGPVVVKSDPCFGGMSPSVRVRRIHGRGTGQCRPDACTGAARIHSAFRGMGDALPADQGGRRR